MNAFERFAPLNRSAILEAYLDLVFGSVIDGGSALSEDKI
jgi:hypothetical protein